MQEVQKFSLISKRLSNLSLKYAICLCATACTARARSAPEHPAQVRRYAIYGSWTDRLSRRSSPSSLSRN